MQEQPLFIATVEPISPKCELVALVNSTDDTALPHTHLYEVREDQIPLLLVTGNAVFTGIGVAAGKFIYFSGYNGHVITNCPSFDFMAPSREDLIHYEPSGQSCFSMGKVADSDITLSIGFERCNTVFFCTKDGHVLVYSDAALKQKIVISADPVSYCSDDMENVYVGTEGGKVWLLDAEGALELPMPDTGLPNPVISGLAIGPAGDLYAVSRNGFIAKKPTNGDFSIMKAPIVHYNGISFVNGIMYISAREGFFAAKEWKGEVTLIPLRDSFNPLSLFSSRNELYLTSATPRSTPYFVKAIPGDQIDQLDACYAMNLFYEVN
ncbi:MULTISPECIES: PQQ-binding-like beta-propeller repeat protein [Vibrio]|uniref:PQQ-binding-like beta-propeller repeat protein n=1 Tax=Vibrio TaxID=662 RepID=UPI0001B93B9F|nr:MULTISPECIES: PQQ-binding-like beta-propeller repeat protein [Vibrio]EEX34434.1 hypothetical protein VIC_001232 [Vibrio coralliilyticus ATCC BAA-450]MDE3898474.1 PQQ-like beta-propeller repeat protein [Vibrio sp. CC007]